MSDTVIEPKPANPKTDERAGRIAAQQRSGTLPPLTAQKFRGQKYRIAK